MRRLPLMFSLLLTILTLIGWNQQLPQTVANGAWHQAFTGGTNTTGIFQAALLADPAFAWRWSDLGIALDREGQTAQAAACLNRSLALAPSSPQLMFRAAGFHFRHGETTSALRLGSAILAQSGPLDDAVFSAYVRFGGSMSGVIENGIGSNRRAVDAFFRFTMAYGSPTQAREVWQWIESHHVAATDIAGDWAAWLLRQGDPAAAASVWTRYVVHDPAYRVSNWIYDPGFERGPETNPFGWQIASSPEAKIGFDEHAFHSGRQSVRIDFAADSNLDFHHVSERVWLEPGTWQLSGWIKTDSLSTDEGIRLQADAGAPTASLTGNHEWTSVSTQFAIQTARAVNVQVVRKPSWKFDNKPHGTAWIDDVELSYHRKE